MKPSSSPGASPPAAPRRSGWTLSGEAFGALLARLGSGEEQAAAEYERLRGKLTVFFCGRRCPEPEECADETLERVGRRVGAGADIQDVDRFAHGVARLVLIEWLKRDRRHRRALRTALPAVSGWAGYESDRGLQCIQMCAAGLTRADRLLILGYYQESGRDQQGQRRELAARLGLSPGALRLRAHRIRRQLEACARACMKGRTP